jgi:hypothetical protein
MKRQKPKRPRIRKASEESTRERKPRNPPQITGFWGRGASLYRPGLFTKKYFVEHGEACAADIYHALSEEIERLNAARAEIGEAPFKRPNYSSFAKYFHWFKLMELVEPIDRREPAIYDFLEERVFYKLTDKGKVEVQAWEDPARTAHPEFG